MDIMDILLINTNPIVSNLFQSLVKDKAMKLQEVSGVEQMIKQDYHVIFIDESLCQKNLIAMMDSSRPVMKVCMSYSPDMLEGFDVTLQKPFLPSQIMDILEHVQVMDKKVFSVLDSKEIETIKSLLDMEDLENRDIEKNSIKKKCIKDKAKKNTKNMTIQIKNLKKKAIKRLLKGKEIKIRIQLSEEFE